LQVLGNFSGDHIGIGQVGRVLKAVVFKPKDVQVDLVALEEFLVREGLEAFSLFARVAILRVVAGNEVIQVFAFERICFQGEMLVGSEIVNP
jgi:hypothetical protein